MRTSTLLLAAAGTALADNFKEFCQRNGLTHRYYEVMKDHPTFYEKVETHKGDLTIFVPTNTAMEDFEQSAASDDYSFSGIQKLLEYMVVTDDAYTFEELEKNAPMKLTTMFGDDVKLEASGVDGDNVKVYISSGTGFTHNSTVGVDNTNFHCTSGIVQLVNKVFKLPDAVSTDSGAVVTSSAAKNTLGALSVLTLLGAGLVAVL